ncbi:hypothetical protein [Sinorhizobium meliloti]|uniref:hypothetical protein n=1 Tax=Rhizobium meliloti TaxID=382 RepID=UPI0002FA25C2|nr:hypothetical protein [Sinorhizobium meliloti]MQV24947.1 hypothetical protein [Sinorhizobium meliloti]MQV37383.1 hypothetical protein [Sinorhizobium meliloti]MQW20124.1 hypothetical protein [Sinorhizobium meliloti]
MRATSWFQPHAQCRAEEGCWVVDRYGRLLLNRTNNYCWRIHGHAHGPDLEAVSA